MTDGRICFAFASHVDPVWGLDYNRICSNAATQTYIHKCGFTTIYHMNKANNENIGHSLCAFISKYGLPEHLTYDGASVQVGSKTIFQNHVRKDEIQTQ